MEKLISELKECCRYFIGRSVCIRCEELQDLQLGLDWPVPGLLIYFNFYIHA